MKKIIISAFYSLMCLSGPDAFASQTSQNPPCVEENIQSERLMKYGQETIEKLISERAIRAINDSIEWVNICANREDIPMSAVKTGIRTAINTISDDVKNGRPEDWNPYHKATANRYISALELVFFR